MIGARMCACRYITCMYVIVSGTITYVLYKPFKRLTIPEGRTSVVMCTILADKEAHIHLDADRVMTYGSLGG